MSEAKSVRRSQGRAAIAARWVLCAVAGVTICGAETAIAEVSSSSLSARLLSKSAPDSSTLLRGNGKLTGNHERDLRNLAGDTRPLASRQLVQLSTQHAILNDPHLRLALVRALAKHETELAPDENVRLEILRVLMRLFTADDEPTLVTTDSEVPHGGLRHLARGSAAMALARSQHPLALKKLLATALGGAQQDPIGARLAVTALRSLEEEPLHTPELVRLFSADAIERIAHPAERERLFSTEGLTPASLIKAAKAERSARENPDAERAQLSESRLGPSFEELVVELLRSRDLPRAFARVRTWETAWRREPVWTLRTLALLKSRLDAPVINWGKRTAQKATRASSELVRSAGAWCVATIAPDSVRDLLHEKDDVTTRAILSQASEGKVAEIVGEFLRKKKLDPEAARLGFRMVVHAPEQWPTFSTAFLREHQLEMSPAVLAPLSSRLRVEPHGLGPDVTTVEGWLASSSPEVRSATALGLAHASAGPARGLLFQAYQRESNPVTRRAIVASIAKTSLAKNSQFLQLLSIDPDPQCRELMIERAVLNRPGVHISWSVRRTVQVTDREGRVLELAPAPDGFVGIVRSSF